MIYINQNRFFISYQMCWLTEYPVSTVRLSIIHIFLPPPPNKLFSCAPEFWLKWNAIISIHTMKTTFDIKIEVKKGLSIKKTSLCLLVNLKFEKSNQNLNCYIRLYTVKKLKICPERKRTKACKHIQEFSLHFCHLTLWAFSHFLF